MSENDWTTVTIRGRRTPAAPKKPTLSSEAAYQRRLEDSEELLKPTRTLTSDSRQLIIQKRIAAKWSQGDLDRQCSFPQHTVQEIEAGRATPSPAQLNILNRVLGVALKYAHS